MSEIQLPNVNPNSSLIVDPNNIAPVSQRQQPKKGLAKKQKALAKPAPDEKIDISEDLEMQSQTALDAKTAIQAREFSIRQDLKGVVVNERSQTYKEVFDTYRELDRQFENFVRAELDEMGIDFDSYIDRG